jgi:hypothetical protein
VGGDSMKKRVFKAYKIILLVFFLLIIVVNAGTNVPHTIYGYVEDGSGIADGSQVKVYPEGNSNDYITDLVGENGNYGSSGWWKVNLYNLNSQINDNDVIHITVNDGNNNVASTLINVDLSLGNQRVSDLILEQIAGYPIEILEMKILDSQQTEDYSILPGKTYYVYTKSQNKRNSAINSLHFVQILKNNVPIDFDSILMNFNALEEKENLFEFTMPSDAEAEDDFKANAFHWSKLINQPSPPKFKILSNSSSKLFNTET